MNTVEPIRDGRKLAAMKAVLKERSLRNYLLFVLGINFALRIMDLLNLKISDLVDEQGRIVNSFTVREGKTRKERDIFINQAARKAIQEYLDNLGDYDPDWYLFRSQKGINRPISREHAYEILNDAAKTVGIKERIGTHTLRKTFGYWARMKGLATIEQLQEIYNHATPAVTKRYIGITQKEINEIYRRLNL